MHKYFSIAAEYDEKSVIYAENAQINVKGADKYVMECNTEKSQIMFELTETQTEVIIEPLCENATFTFLGEEYKFGKVNDDTYAVLDLATLDEGSTGENNFEIINAPEENPSKNCSCNCHKGGIKGFFFKFLLFLQKIFRTNRECKCGISHY